jgi:uncharacterized protein YbbK (DUF523 family)
VIRILVSACLLGERVRYDGSDATSSNEALQQWLRDGRLVPFCPEVAGNLPVPRPPAEIAPGDGRSVLEGTSAVWDREGRDVTSYLMAGARLALEAARQGEARLAILKDGSPSCGSSFIYDGTFRGMRSTGQGVTTALLESEGIRVFNERQILEAVAYLAELESGSGDRR